MAVLKVETDIITSISASPIIGQTVILVIMSVDTFKTDIIVFIGHVRLTDIFLHASYKLTTYVCGSR